MSLKIKISVIVFVVIAGFLYSESLMNELICFSTGYLWNFLIGSQALKATAEKKHYRFSFIRFYGWYNAFFVRSNLNPLLQFSLKLIPAFGFVMLLVLIFQSSIPVYYCILGSFLFEVFSLQNKRARP